MPKKITSMSSAFDNSNLEIVPFVAINLDWQKPIGESFVLYDVYAIASLIQSTM